MVIYTNLLNYWLNFGKETNIFNLYFLINQIYYRIMFYVFFLLHVSKPKHNWWISNSLFNYKRTRTRKWKHVKAEFKAKTMLPKKQYEKRIMYCAYKSNKTNTDILLWWSSVCFLHARIEWNGAIGWNVGGH